MIDNPQLDEEALTVMDVAALRHYCGGTILARLGILGYDIDELDDSGIRLNALYDCFAGQSLFCCIASAGGSELAQPVLTDKASTVLELLRNRGITRQPDEKCRRFMEHFSEFRTFAANNSIERLIRRIYDDTDFFSGHLHV